MGQPKRLGSGTSRAGLAIEYVRTRKVVRLRGWQDGEAIDPVEIPVGDLCRHLGIAPKELGAPTRYLLFSGQQGVPGGGTGDLTGTFASEDAAWSAFRALRQTHPSAGAWAELASIDGSGHVGRIAWFGLPQAGTGQPTMEHSWRRRRLARAEAALAGARPASAQHAALRAVRPS